MARDDTPEEIDAKLDAAVKLLGIAAQLAPAAANILEFWLAGTPEDEPLADRIRAVMPAESASERARRELERRKGQEG